MIAVIGARWRLMPLLALAALGLHEWQVAG